MNKKFSAYLIFTFTLLLIITVLGIVSIVYYHSQAVAMKTAEKQFKRESKNLAKKTWQYLNAAASLTKQTTHLFNNPKLELKLNSNESNYLLKSLSIYNQIDLIYYGNNKGDFLQAADFTDIYVKLIKREDGKAFTLYNYYKSYNGEIENTKTTLDSQYDPRVRPWYIGAAKTKKTFWTEPYIFFATQKPGITVSEPILDKHGELMGVIGVDIPLARLSAYL